MYVCCGSYSRIYWAMPGNLHRSSLKHRSNLEWRNGTALQTASCATTEQDLTWSTWISCLVRSSVSTAQATLRGQASAWQRSNASFAVMAGGYGPRERSIAELLFTSLFQDYTRKHHAKPPPVNPPGRGQYPR